MDSVLFLIPLLPLIGFLFNFIVGVRLLTPRGAHASAEHPRPSPDLLGSRQEDRPLLHIHLS